MCNYFSLLMLKLLPICLFTFCMTHKIKQSTHETAECYIRGDKVANFHFKQTESSRQFFLKWRNLTDLRTFKIIYHLFTGFLKTLLKEIYLIKT